MRISDWSSDVCSSDLSFCDRNRLADVENATRDIGCIDLQHHRARIGLVGGQRDDVRLHRQAGGAVAGLGVGGGGKKGEGRGEKGGRDERCVFHGARYCLEMAARRSEEPTSELQSLM